MNIDDQIRQAIVISVKDVIYTKGKNFQKVLRDVKRPLLKNLNITRLH